MSLPPGRYLYHHKCAIHFSYFLTLQPIISFFTRFNRFPSSFLSLYLSHLQLLSIPPHHAPFSFIIHPPFSSSYSSPLFLSLLLIPFFRLSLFTPSDAHHSLVLCTDGGVMYFRNCSDDENNDEHDEEEHGDTTTTSNHNNHNNNNHESFSTSSSSSSSSSSSQVVGKNKNSPMQSLMEFTALQRNPETEKVGG